MAVAASCVASCGEDDATTALTVWAFEERLDLDSALKPLAGADIAFDPPGGGARLTLTVAADGHATFEGDFTRGEASVTVFDRQHVLVSAIEVSPDAVRAHPNTIGKPPGDLVMFAPTLDDVIRASTVELRGALVGKRDATTSIDLSASGVSRLGSLETTEAAYSLRVPRGRPFFLLGHETKNLESAPTKLENELVGSFRIDVPALDADTTRDIDVAAAAKLDVRTVHLRADLPLGATSPFGTGTRCSGTVLSADSRLLVAPIASALASADGHAFDLGMFVAATDIAPERPLTRVSLVAADGSRSVRVEPGIVADATTMRDFLLPPLVVAGPAPAGLNEPITFDDFPAGAELAVEIYAGPQLAWVITGPARDASRARGPLTLPHPVEIRMPALVVASFSARTDRLDLAPRGEIYRRVSISRDVLFRR